MHDSGSEMRDPRYEIKTSRIPHPASRIPHPASRISSQSDEIQQKLAPKIDHPAPRIFHLAVGRGFQDAFLDIVRDLIAQIVLHLELDPVFVHRINDAGLDLVLPEEFLVTLV